VSDDAEIAEPQRERGRKRQHVGRSARHRRAPADRLTLRRDDPLRLCGLCV